MVKKGNLFLLIKSLSKSEKRYIRIFAGASGKEANYLQLFDAIEEQADYDEEQIRQKLKGKKFLSQLHVTKIYLTELIMKALKNYHSDNSISSRLVDLLRDIELLFDRELYDLCYSRIQKAEELAERYEKLALLIEVLSWKRKLVLAISGDKKEIHALLQKENDAISQMKVLNSYWQTTVNIGNFLNDENFLEEFTAKENESTFALQSRVLHFHILYGLHFMKGDIQGADTHISNLIQLLERFQDRIKEDPHSYVTAISNKISLYLAFKKWDEIPALLNRIREVPSKYRRDSQSKFTVRLWLRTYNVELEMYRDSQQLVKATRLMDEILVFIEMHRNSIPADYSLLLHYQFAYIFYLKKEYSKALAWLNKILNAKYGNTREDIQCYARILNLIVHFELNNIIVLRYALDSCRRFLKKNRFELASGKEILNLFSKLSHAYPDEYQVIFTRAYNDILTANPRTNQDYIDIKGWLEKKLKL